MVMKFQLQNLYGPATLRKATIAECFALAASGFQLTNQTLSTHFRYHVLQLHES